MNPGPKTENGFDPLLHSGDWRDRSKLNNMSISELVSEVRDTFLQSDFDLVEETLVAREAKLKAEITRLNREVRSLHEKMEIERLDKVRFESDIDKRVQKKMLEILVKVKENSGLDGNIELENEKCKLDDDRDAVAELRSRISELEEEKKKWVGERGVIAELRAQNQRLVEEKLEAELSVESWKRKFCELNEKLLLVNGDTTGGGNNKGESLVPFGENDEKKMMELDVCGTVHLRRNEDAENFKRKSPSIQSKDDRSASAGGRLGMQKFIDISSDEDECNSQGTLVKKETHSGIILGHSQGMLLKKETPPGIILGHEHRSSSAVQQKNFATELVEHIGILGKKFASSRELGTNINILDGLDSDPSSSSSSSSSGSLDLDSSLLSSLSSIKKMRTEAANL